MVMYQELRRSLVKALKREGIIRSKLVEDAMLKVPREKFVWPGYESRAYDDTPLPLGDTGQTISAPHMVAIMLEELRLRPGHFVLEIGTGSGYSSALTAEIIKPGGRLVTIERVPELAFFAKRNLMKIGLGEDLVQVIVGDGSLGCPPRVEREIYDRVVVTAAAPRRPRYLIAQLKRGGVMLAPVGPMGYQQLVRFIKRDDGSVIEEILGECVFVPLVGEDGYK